MNVCLVLVTHNRLEYTRKCLDRLLSDNISNFDLYIWDNASTDETPSYLRDGISDARIRQVILHRENPGPTFAINQIWSATKAELVGKVDNDCLLSAGWVNTLATAHRDVPSLGAIACWHFRAEDFKEEIAARKIQRYGQHSVFRHPWICGCGFLLKRTTFIRMGPCSQGDRRYGLTGYFLDMALAGYTNGWYYPLVYQEHMDDPLSSHCLFKDDASMQALKEVTYTMRTHNIKTYAQRLKRRAFVLRNLLYGPADPRQYIGWRSKARRLLPRLDEWRWRASQCLSRV